MVQLWISLTNRKLYRKCINSKITRIFQNKQTYFYGDNELEIYIGTKNEYKSLEEVVDKVITIESGWIRNCGHIWGKDPKEEPLISLYRVINQLGNIDENLLKKIFPRKEDYIINENCRYLIYRNDGNFHMSAYQSNKFFYVFCFATS
jgi:hypothetical protein